MTTSGSVDFNVNARDVCTFALTKIRITPLGESPSAEDAAQAKLELNLMLKSLQSSAPSLWRQTFGSVALVAGTASYELDPRPFRVVEARYRNAGGSDLPMQEMTRQEYADLVLKTSTGVPTTYYVDYQRDAVTIYVWPVPASATTETIEFTYQRRFEDVDTLDDDIDVTQEAAEAVGYMLATRLAVTYGKEPGAVGTMAATLIRGLQDEDREPFVRFVPDRRR